MPTSLEFSRDRYMSRCRDSCTIFGYVLRKRFQRLKKEDPAIVGLSEFDVDKTMRFLAKIWRQRSEEIILGSGGTHKPSNRIDAFPVEPNYNDKHGHRLAFPPAGETPNGPTRDLKPVLTVIQAFDSKVPDSEKILITKQIDEPWGIIERFVPQISSTSLIPLVQSGRIDESDIEFLTRLGDVFGVLTEWEIQAIGRHESAEWTQDSLLEEFARWYWFSTEALRQLKTGEDPRGAARLLWQCWSFALECIRKAGLPLVYMSGKDANRYTGDNELYELALEKVKTELRETEALDNREREISNRITHFIDKVQPPSNQIWLDPRVSVLGFPAFCCWTFATFLSGTLKELNIFARTILPSRLSSVTPSDVDSASENILRLSNLPPNSQPKIFTLGWWEQQKPALNQAIPIPSRDDLQQNPAVLADFVSSAELMLNSLWDNFMANHISNIRLQKGA